MKRALRGLAVALAVAGARPAAPARAQPAGADDDERRVPAYTLPDPLRFADGTAVRDAGEWTGRRRAEVLQLFETHVYGRSPGPLPSTRAVVLESDAHALGGLATRRQVLVRLDGTDDGPGFSILLYVPNAASRPVPAFLGLNFGGNHTVHPDPAIRLTRSWMREGPGVVEHRATAAGRGTAAPSWPVERILDRGFALATVYYGELEPDHEDGWKDGVRSRIGAGRAGRFGPDDWGAIGAWAWGLSRALDVLERDPDVDGRRVAVIGHSRLGKTALWAGAQDERFFMVVSNDSGEGGAALARRRFGETTAAITSAFPHWFCSRYREYAGREDALPVDQHLLLALVAPRPLYVASATEDLWADPRGEFLAAKAAEPVYRLLGREGLGAADMPVPDRPLGGSIRYHLRSGPHALTAYDWEQYLEFAERWLRGPTRVASGGRPDTREILADAAFATLFVATGLLSFVAAARWRPGRAASAVLGWALLQHGVALAAGSPGLRAALGGQREAWIWLGTVTGYLIPVPWALLLERVVGPGWGSSIRRTWQVYAVSAAAAIAVDVATGEPGGFAGAVRPVVVAGALVGFLNLTLGRLRTARDLRVLRLGYLVLLALVVHDYLVDLALLPSFRTGQLGLLVFVASLVYTVASRTLRAQRQLESLRLELAAARRIQRSLLPPAPPRLAGARVAFRHVPATTVAGDLFEFLDVGPDRAGVLVADVSGHGMGAALIASMVKVAAAAQGRHADDPPRVLAGIHAALADHLPAGQFVTAVYVHLDLARGLLRHASAGHPPALLRRAGEATAAPVGDTGPLLASIAPREYPLAQVPIAAGDRVLLYTDGVVEATDARDDMFGPERLRALVARAPDDPEALLAAVVDEVAAFAGARGRDFADDLTLVAVAVEGRAALKPGE